MAFSFKSPAFREVLSELLRLGNRCVNSKETENELRKWAEIYIENHDFFSSIDLLEKNIVETKKWDEFDLVQVFNNFSSDELEFLKTALLVIYIYIKEYNFRNILPKNESLKNRLKSEIQLLKNKEYLKYKIYFDYLDDLPYRICREIYSNSQLNEIRKFLEEKDFSSFNELIEKSEIATEVIKDWSLKFDEKTDEVKALGLKLDNYKTSYDFVLLNEGFKRLYDQKKNELDKAKNTYGFIAATMFTIPFAEFVALVAAFFYFDGEIPSNMWLVSIPFITLILITLYLLKISLQDKRAIQSQMMQLELRMALCQFIHNYAEDSEKLHAKNRAGFEKFENIIFSPLVSSDDKIPTTFDGMEQLAKLIGEFRRN